MLGLGLPELIVIVLVIFFLFGPKALPHMARDLGRFMRFLKREIKGVTEEVSFLNEDKIPSNPPFSKGGVDTSSSHFQRGGADASHSPLPKEGKETPVFPVEKGGPGGIFK